MALVQTRALRDRLAHIVPESSGSLDLGHLNSTLPGDTYTRNAYR